MKKKQKPSTYALAWGNPFSGIFLQGPYDTREEVDEAAGGLDADWWIVELIPPEES